MSVEVICGELRTGRILAVSQPGTATQWAASGSWSTVHRDIGQMKITVPLAGNVLRQNPGLLSFLEPGRCFIGFRVPESGQVLNAGPIWSHSWDGAGQSLGLTALGIGSVFERRRLVPVLGPGERVQDSLLSFRGLSLGSIAKRLVELALSHPGGNLPLVLPADVPGADERSYKGVELGKIWERINQLSAVAGGPDIAFIPRMSGPTALEWVMRIGEPLLTQSGADWQWDLATGSSTVLSMDVTRDATKLASRAWAIGSGQGNEAVIGMAEDPSLVRNSDFPLLEASVSQTSVSVQTTIDSYAQALVASSSRPWQTWKLVVSASGSPALGDYRPGDWCRILIPEEHPYLRPGPYRTRILAISGQLGSEAVDVEIAPTMEAR
ncbi:hypothetical protein [Arthrobacter russicus]|uniref:Minor tail protein n=1 Tax=Arthrobacter russicus TaxID=172040 RepID=A0ABU1J7Y2_9MICC|nr:hypothetical protein [Arthrobacter russicus]MDN5668251.1 hypothetical protein [Renibacterium salmoninarum]MDR6268541.1 hypothetical protein [Arthrobacter russicus]